MHQKHYLKQKKEKKQKLHLRLQFLLNNPINNKTGMLAELPIMATLEEGEVTEIEAEDTLKTDPVRLILMT